MNLLEEARLIFEIDRHCARGILEVYRDSQDIAREADKKNKKKVSRDALKLAEKAKRRFMNLMVVYRESRDKYKAILKKLNRKYE